MTTPTTIDTDTNLSAVNSILGAIGQSPVTELNYQNPELGFIFNILTEVNKDVQNEGWVFNVEKHVPAPINSNKRVPIANNILRYDLSDNYTFRTQDLVRRTDPTDEQTYLYNTVDHTYEFNDPFNLDVVYLWEFTEMPSVFQRYIISRASVRAATQLVNNPQLVQLLQQQEAVNRASCMEYECTQGDHSYFGLGHNQSYQSYEPFRALQR